MTVNDSVVGGEAWRSSSSSSLSSHALDDAAFI